MKKPDGLASMELVLSVQASIDDQVEIFIRKVLELHNILSLKVDLRPSSQINDLLGQLVGLCTQTFSDNATKTVSRLVFGHLPSWD
jgi:hypothetical protein